MKIKGFWIRWRRMLVSAAIIAAHVLVIWLFPSGYVLQDTPEEEASLELMFVPASSSARPGNSSDQRLTASKAVHGFHLWRRRQAATNVAARSEQTTMQETDPMAAPASVDWENEAKTVADDRIRAETAASLRDSAFTQWKSRIMPSAAVPATPTFGWDYAATHRIQPTAGGLVIALNDRCSLVISLSIMAVMAGCALGEIPVNGDLFLHMRDGDGSSAPVP